MIDSAEYAYRDLRLFLLGREVTGFQRVRWGSRQDKSLLYAKGDQPIAIQRGNVSYMGEITLLTSEVEAIRTALKAQGKRGFLWEVVTFTAVVQLAREGETVGPVYKLTAQFTEDMRGLDQGQQFEQIVCPLIVLRID